MVSAVGEDSLTVDVGTKAIVIATVGNTLVKAGIAFFFASRGMRRPVVTGLCAMAFVGLVYLLVT